MTNLMEMVEALRGVDTDNVHHPERNQFNHTVQVTLLAYANKNRVPEQYRRAFLQAAILHDCGKATSMARNGTTHGHESDSAKMIQPYVSDAVVWLVTNHLRIMHVDVMRRGKREALVNHPMYTVLQVLRECDVGGRSAEFKLNEANENFFYCVAASAGVA